MITFYNCDRLKLSFGSFTSYLDYFCINIKFQIRKRASLREDNKRKFEPSVSQLRDRCKESTNNAFTSKRNYALEVMKAACIRTWHCLWWRNNEVRVVGNRVTSGERFMVSNHGRAFWFTVGHPSPRLDSMFHSICLVNGSILDTRRSIWHIYGYILNLAFYDNCVAYTTSPLHTTKHSPSSSQDVKFLYSTLP